MFDLILSSMNLEAGQDRKELPGLYVAVPKKAARLRAGDRLILMLSQGGTAPLPSNMLQEIFMRLSETYYASTGSVTSGLKAVAERLNDFLINRNMRQSRQQGGQTVGLLNMAVLRGSTLLVAHAGPLHTYMVSGGKVEHFTDASAISRGLGLAKLVSLRFYRTTFDANAGLVLSSSAPARWNDVVLTAAFQLDASAAHIQLVAGSVDLQAGLVRIKPGKGDIRWDLPQVAYRASESAQPAEAAPQRSASWPAAMAQAQPVAVEPAADETLAEVVEPEVYAVEASGESLEEETLAADGTQLEETAESIPLGVYLSAPPSADPAFASLASLDRAPWEEETQPMATPDVPPAPSIPEPAQRHQPAGRIARQRLSQEHVEARPAAQPAPHETAAAPRPVRPPRTPLAAAVGSARFLAGVIAGTRKTWGGMVDGFSKLLARALPDQFAEGLQLSASTMLFIALAVPVMVVAVAATIYAQRGRGELQLANVQAARQYVDQAAQREDIVLRRQDWNQAMGLLDKAEMYGESQAATDLREVVQRGMDDLDGVTRIAFRSAVNGSLGEGVKIIRMVGLASDIYMLDASQGRILRMSRAGQAYELDPSFACGPVNYGNVTVGKLLDITLLPPDNIAKANVMGIDAGGNVLFCSLTEKPAVFTLPVPDSNWGNITRAVYFQDGLYVLDAVSNQIYRFVFVNGQIKGGAGFYFDNQIPKLDDVVDIAVDQEYIYLLHADGTMTSCSDTGDKTVCDDPAPYGDARQGYEPSPLKFAGASFVILQATQPPDPSLYILDANNYSVYHLSLRKLNLQRQYRPLARADYPPQDKKASAFLITPNRRLMLAVDNQAYFGLLP